MNKKKAVKFLKSILHNYENAIKAFSRADALGRRGKTTQALAERDKAADYIHKAEWAAVELTSAIEEA